MKGEIPAAESAKEYENEVREFFGTSKPQFDLILLGMGDDGHTASLFPDTTALQDNDRLVTENYVPKLSANRVTMTYFLINQAKNILFLVSGASKRPALEQVFGSGDVPSKHVGS